MVDPSLDLSRLSTLSLSLWLTTQKFVQRFPLGSGIPGFPYCTNELALLSALWNCPLSLSGLTVVDLGLVPLSLLWSGSSPSVDAKEVPRLNEFLALPPSGGLATPTRETTHHEALAGRWNTPRLQLASTKRGSYLTSTRTGFRPFPA